MDSSAVSQWAGPPSGKLDPYRGSQKPRRGTSHLLVGLVTVSKRWMWQIFLAIIPLVANTAAYNESHLAASYQTLPGARPRSPAPLSFQNSTNKWNMTDPDLSNGFTKGHPPWHPTGRYLYSGNAGYHSTDLPKQDGFLSNQYRKTEVSYPTPATPPETLSASPQGSASPGGTTPGTTDAGIKGLYSSSGAHSSLTFVLQHSTNTLSDLPPTQPSDSSSGKTHSEQMTPHTGQETGITEPATKVSPTSAAPVTLLPFSIRFLSSHSAKGSSHLSLPDFIGSTTSIKFPIHYQAEPLGTSLFQSTPAPTAAEIRTISALSTESPSNVGNSINQLATEIPIHIPYSSEAGMPELSLSLATTQLDPNTVVVGMPAEANFSSQLKDDLRSPALTALPPSLRTTKAYEVSSLATEDALSTSLAERTKLEWKGITSHRGEESTKLYVGPTHDAISKGTSSSIRFGPDVLYWQPSTASPLGTLHSGDTGTGYDIPLLQDGPLEAVTNTPSGWELVKMGQSTKTAVVSPILSLELILTTTETMPTLRLASSLISVQPKADLAGQHNTLPQRWSKLPPPSSTSLATSRVVLTSEEPSGLEASAESSVTKKYSNDVAPKPSEGTGSTLQSLPYLDTIRFTLPTEPTSSGMAHLHTGGPTEHFGVTSPEWKDGIPMPLHTTASLTDMTKLERSSVLTTHRSVSTSFSSLDSSRTSVPELTLEMHFGATEKAQKDQEVSEITVLSSLSSAEVWQPGSKAVTPSPISPSTLYRTLPPLPLTKDLEVDPNTSAVITTLETELRYKSVDASTAVAPLDDNTTALHIPRQGYIDSSGSNPPVSMPVSESSSAQNVLMSSATAALLTTPRFLPDKSKSTCNNIYCRMRTTTSSFTPSLSPPHLYTTSQPLLTRKVLVSTLGTGDVMKNRSTVGVDAKATSSKENKAKTVTGAKRGTVIPGTHSSRQPVSPKVPVLSESATKANLTTLTTPTLLVPAVHALPLWFRLTGINYTKALGNKSSESFKKLEKEVKLTVNKMLSTYESFLQTNILHFLNGSVIVESEAIFQTKVPVPTPSDVIRTIVTEVKRRAMDTFFDWRLDVQSLHSNGFTLNNLEPEKLDISFNSLGLASRGALDGMMNWDHLESLGNKVTQLLGACYAVRNISLVESGNIQGGININGEVYIDTDTHVDIGWALEALMALSNYSVDLTSLSINGQ
ncbi:mucin-3A-like isoform X2 [Sceloporus undulatus]|uniref:mucin-3A-like isoform X2 n=1 Tax=Sceloporus undulatus TaxID=8520 RepID=UPI001C4CB4AB|nr:mucin-3A-like isoform X2 [Sceloporus undulatus]